MKAKIESMRASKQNKTSFADKMDRLIKSKRNLDDESNKFEKSKRT